MKYICGKCGKKGHNARTCTGKKAKKKHTPARRGTSRTVTRGRSWVSGSGWITLYHGGRTKGVQHDKVWSVKIEKSGSKYRVVTRWGRAGIQRAGGRKRETRHSLTSRETAVAKADSLIAQKLRKGYVFAGRNRSK